MVLQWEVKVLAMEHLLVCLEADRDVYPPGDVFVLRVPSFPWREGLSAPLPSLGGVRQTPRPRPPPLSHGGKTLTSVLLHSCFHFFPPQWRVNSLLY